MRARIPATVDLDCGTLAQLLPNPALTPRWDQRDTDERQLMVLDGHTGGVSSVVFNQDGTLIATASDDGTARIWETDTGTRLTTVRVGQRAASIACADLALALAYDKTFMVYDLIVPD